MTLFRKNEYILQDSSCVMNINYINFHCYKWTAGTEMTTFLSQWGFKSSKDCTVGFFLYIQDMVCWYPNISSGSNGFALFKGFLECLGFKSVRSFKLYNILDSTQYIRHHSAHFIYRPEYLPWIVRSRSTFLIRFCFIFWDRTLPLKLPRMLI
jgi:hypothetical protein